MTHLLDFPIVRQHELGALKVFSMCGGCKVVTTINHDIADDKSTAPLVSDDPAIHDILDDKSRGFVSDDVTTGTAAPGSSHSYTGPVQGLHNEYIGVTSDHLNIGVTTAVLMFCTDRALAYRDRNPAAVAPPGASPIRSTSSR